MIYSSRNGSVIFLSLFAATFAAASALVALTGYTWPSLILAAFSGILLIVGAKWVSGSYLSISLFFLLASLLYGVSGPLSALSTDGLPPKWPTPYLVDYYIMHFALSNVGSAMAIIAITYFPAARPQQDIFSFNPNLLYTISLCLATISAITTIINTARAGGLYIVFLGKAAYQSEISDLTGTLPSSWFLFASAAVFGLSLAYKPRGLSSYLVYLLTASPCIGVMLILGQRMSVASVAISLFACLRFFSPLRKIGKRYLTIGVILYIFVALLYAFRGAVPVAYQKGDIGVIIDRIYTPGVVAEALNPGESEFQAAFGNFNTHAVFERVRGWRLGETYLTGFTIPIPGFIWPEKPQSITYEFRDAYFSFEASRGRIAGTGFSSMLESYINFGTIGVMAMQFVIAYTVLWLDASRYRVRWKWFPVFYTLLIPWAFTFYRSSLGMPFFMPAVLTIFSAIIYLMLSEVTLLGPARQRRPRARPSGFG